jgi:predicted N-acetyltransferase YhbS
MTTLALLRPMTEADVNPATDLLRRGQWGERDAFFRYAIRQPFVRPVLAERDGQIVGTGVASAHGAVGWIGTIFVAESERGQGLGRALTEATMADLRDLGCETQVLVATDLGRPIYERLGFATRTFYRTFELEGRISADGETPDDGIRRFSAADLDDAAALDAQATGEERRGVLAAMTDVEGGLVLRSPGGMLEGFVLRAPWGGGATVAASLAAALRLLDARRLRAGPDRLVRVGTPLENAAGMKALEAAGWRPTWTARRMELGPLVPWRPDCLWGQFNMAIG